MLRDFRISELRTLLNTVTPSILRKKLDSDACTCDRTLLVITTTFMTITENGDKIQFENWELCLFWQFAFHDNRTVQSSHYCTSLAYSGMQFFILPSVTRKCNPKILELFICFSVVPFTCSTHWSGFLQRWSTSVPAVLIFILAVLHASAKLFNARWRPDSVEESKTKSSANSRRLILQFPVRAHSSAWLHLSLQFM